MLVQVSLEPARFGLKGESGDVAGDEPDDEDGEPEATAAGVRQFWGGKIEPGLRSEIRVLVG
jgi:hypothetical protein